MSFNACDSLPVRTLEAPDGRDLPYLSQSQKHGLYTRHICGTDMSAFVLKDSFLLHKRHMQPSPGMENDTAQHVYVLRNLRNLNSVLIQQHPCTAKPVRPSLHLLKDATTQKLNTLNMSTHTVQIISQIVEVEVVGPVPENTKELEVAHRAHEQ